MSSSIDHFIRQTRDAASVAFDRIELAPARLSVYVCVPGARWLLRSPGPYKLLANDGASVPIHRGLAGHRLLADLHEPQDALHVAPSRQTLATLGLLFVEHRIWAGEAPIAFGKFLDVPEVTLTTGGCLARGPRSFVAAMKRALDRMEIVSWIEVVHPEPDEFAADYDLVLLGEKNYVRAMALSAEEVSFDHGCDSREDRDSRRW